MRKLLLLLFLIPFFGEPTDAQNDPFILELTTTRMDTITIPTKNFAYDFTISWGDGSAAQNITGTQPVVEHVYTNEGTFDIEITGDFPAFGLGNSNDASKFTDVKQWGDVKFQDPSYMFLNASNINISAADTIDLGGVTSLAGMFQNATNFNSDISHWDVSSVTNFNSMFAGARSFNQPLNSWDVSGAWGFNAIFFAASSFNQDISSWDMSSATNLSAMFVGAAAFNADISSWDVSSAVNMRLMFQGAAAFNQNIDSWDVSSVTNMSGMFRTMNSFNQPLDSWDVSSVINMESMFRNSGAFNQDLSSWDVSSVTDMESMFDRASAFNQDISSWDISNVENLTNFISNTSFSSANYDNLLINWSTLSVKNDVTFGAGDIQYSSNAESARQSLIDTYGWTITDGGPKDVPDPGAFITTWKPNASRVIQIATVGGSEITDYDFTIDWGDGTIENITGDDPDPSHTYAGSGPYDVIIMGTFPAIHLESAPNETKISLQEIKQWGNIEWETFNEAFKGASNMNVTASDAPDLRKVKSLRSMFYNCSSLNADFDNWDVSNIEIFTAMFASASTFNGNILSWDMSSAITLNSMFYQATVFNQDVSNWDVSSVTQMPYTFNFADSFDQDLGKWDVSSVTDYRSFLVGAPISSANYDSLLIGWSTLQLQPNISLTVGAEYGEDAQAARQKIIDDFGWTFSDGGLIEFGPEMTFQVSFDDGTATDLAGNNDGNVQGATPAADRFGNVNQAMSFDGVDDYIDFGDKAVFQMSDRDFSISYWLKFDEAQQAFVIGKRGLPNSYDQYSFSVIHQNDFDSAGTDLNLFIRDQNAATRSKIVSNLMGEWHHVAYVHNADTSATLYIDGEEETVIDLDALDFDKLDVNQSPFVIGYRSQSNDFFYKGLVDDVAIYNYTLSASEIDDLFGDYVSTSHELTGDDKPSEFTLKQNYPNPFNPTTNIEYGIPIASKVNITVYNLMGQQVATLVNSQKSAGYHTLSFDASNLASGIYIYRIQAGSFSQTKKLTLIK